MRMVLALANNPKLSEIPVLQMKCPDLLSSFAYPASFAVFDYPDVSVTPRVFYLDSGAFTAWSKGKAVDIRAYSELARKVTDRWAHAITINLDVIPGEAGRSSTQAEREAGMAQSLRNADFLRGHGLRVMEVFHQDEPWDFLAELVDRRKPGEPLGISPRNDLSIKARTEWLRKLLGWMAKNLGPEHIPPCHGLGATAWDFLKAFPFYSVDSSSWSVGYRYGRVLTDTGGEHSSKRYGNPGAVLSMSLDKPDQREFLFSQVRDSIRALSRRVERATGVWAQRGITWTDDPIELVWR